jgi:hypothetical protein
MKKIKIFSILLLLLLAVSCEKEEINLDENNFNTTISSEIQNNLATVRGEKINVCHNGKIINVSINAVPAHIAHGDAVDMDGDGFFNQASECSTEVDCDDTDETIYFGCCPFTAADLEVLVDMDIFQQIISIASPTSTCDTQTYPDFDYCCHIDENGGYVITRYYIVDVDSEPPIYYYFDISTGNYPPETEDNSSCLEILREEAVKRGIEFSEPIICD